MNKLIVEELESRNLLNAGGIAHQPMQWLMPDRNESLGSMPSQRSYGDFGSFDRMERDFGSDTDTVITEQSITVFILVPDTVNVSPSAPASDSALASNSAPISGSAPAVYRAFDLADFPLDPNPSQATPRFQTGFSPESVPENSVSIQVEAPSLQRINNGISALTALSTSVNGSSSSASTAEALASAFSAKTPALMARADTLAGNVTLRIPIAGLPTDNAPIRGGSEIGPDSELPPARPEPAQPMPQLSIAALPQTPSAKSIRAGLESLPQLAGLLNGFSSADLTGIEQGISNFLDHLEATPGLTMGKGEADLYPWIIASVATTVACEMARQQLKKTAVPASVNLLALPTAPWDVLDEHENG